MTETHDDYRAQLYLLAALYWFNEAEDMFVRRDVHSSASWEYALRRDIQAGVRILASIPIEDIPEMADVLAWDEARMRAPIQEYLERDQMGKAEFLYDNNGGWWADHCRRFMTDEAQALISPTMVQRKGDE